MNYKPRRMTCIATRSEAMKACDLLGTYNLSSARINFLGEIVNSYIDQTTIDVQKRKFFKKLYFTITSTFQPNQPKSEIERFLSVNPQIRNH